jgi:hypothetical protein
MQILYKSSIKFFDMNSWILKFGSKHFQKLFFANIRTLILTFYLSKKTQAGRSTYL